MPVNGGVIETVVAKYCDHLPLYRQQAILEREAGVEISRATLDGWVMRVGELLMPIVGVMGRDLLGEPYLQAEETVNFQEHRQDGQSLRPRKARSARLKRTLPKSRSAD
jgi:transposase